MHFIMDPQLCTVASQCFYNVNWHTNGFQTTGNILVATKFTTQHRSNRIVTCNISVRELPFRPISPYQDLTLIFSKLNWNPSDVKK